MALTEKNKAVNSVALISLYSSWFKLYSIFNLKIFYPPPYERVVWQYQDAINDLIQRSRSQFNWERAFPNKNVNKKISIFNETILKIMTNFIPHETKIFNAREPPRINNKVKQWFKKKTKFISFIWKIKVIC